jgi:copper transport protein
VNVATLLAPVARAAVLACILLMVGAVAFRWMVLQKTTEPRLESERAAARVGALAAALLFPSLLAAFFAQVLSFREPGEPIPSVIALVLAIPWGKVWMVQIVAGLLTQALFIAASRGVRAKLGWALTPWLAAGLAFTPALAGHAAAVEGPTAWAVAADGLHVLAGGAWLGNLAVLAATTLRQPVVPAVLLERLNAFSPLALAAAAVVAATGSFGAWLHLHHVSDLWTSSYGRLLSLKLLLVLGVLAFGAWNWRRATPRLRATDDTAAITRSVRSELALAALVIVITAWFVATSPPEAAP